MALIALAGGPLAFRWAVARERRASVTRWLELHHEAASDPLWGAND
jgi:hypothetical protein